MSLSYISLDQLLQESQVYERMPQFIQSGLRKSVWLTLITQVVAIVILIAIPERIWLTRFPEGEFFNGSFFLGPMAGIMNNTVAFGYKVLPYLLIANLLNLFLTLLILSISLAMLLPVREPVHWLATANAIPAIINAFIFIFSVIVLAGVIIISALIWLIIIGFAIGFAFEATKAALSSK